MAVPFKFGWVIEFWRIRGDDEMKKFKIFMRKMWPVLLGMFIGSISFSTESLPIIIFAPFLATIICAYFLIIIGDRQGEATGAG